MGISMPVHELGLVSTALSQEDLPSFKSFVDDISSVQTTKGLLH